MRSIATLLSLTVVVACGPPAPVASPAPSPANVEQPPTVAVEVDDAFSVQGALSTEKLPNAMPEFPRLSHTLPAVPKGLPKADAACDAFAKRQPAEVSCNDRDDALASFAAALVNTSSPERDAQLAGLESCGELPAGAVRALRAELAPNGCADVIVAPLANAPPEGTSGAVHDALLGLGLAGMLSRAANDPPRMTAKPTKDAVKAFIQSEMMKWVQQQAVAIEGLAALGSKLRYYGKAVVAVEAGMADMRFVDAVRSVPVPEEFEKDDDLRETYLQSLEEALGPRKLRGRDAALVGLGSLATVGVLRDARVDRARTLLSRMFGGRPINALDTLLLPPLAPVEKASPAHALAGRLQTFYASLVFPGEVATDATMLRMLIEKGLSLPHRIALRSQADQLSGDVRLLAARARLELGQNYWRRVDFDEAASLLAPRPNVVLTEDAKLILGVAIALRGGHENAADMMVKAPMSDLGIGRVAALDVIAADKGPHAGKAAFDAALVKQLAAPGNAAADYWRDLAARYGKAHDMLADIRHQKLAADRAKEATETAAAIEKMHRE